MDLTALPLLILSHFTMHPARANCMATTILGMINTSSVRLKSLAQTFGGSAKVDSCVKRLYRFLKLQTLCQQALARFIVSILSIGAPWTISIDRTNWKWGKSSINIFTLGIVLENITIPILFSILPKDGASNAEERIELIKSFLAIWSKDRIKAVVGDREFLCKELLDFLCKEEIGFILRSKKNHLARHHNGGNMSIERCIGETRSEKLITKTTKMWHQTLQLTYYKSSDCHEALYLVHSLSIKASEVLGLYRDRWSIETLFKAEKTNGFYLEETRVTIAERLTNVLAMLFIAIALSVKMGIIKHSMQPIKIKKHGRRAFSVFKYGFDTLKKLLLVCNFNSIVKIFTKLMSSQPPNSYLRQISVRY
jgi:hypothetical protein